jgi:type II secretory pathway pseudopilin PulG
LKVIRRKPSKHREPFLQELEFIMKSSIKGVVVVMSLAASASVFAQSNASNTRITREQVRAELVQLEQAGYRVGDGDQAHYPAAIEAAEARIAAQSNGATSSYGGSVSGSSQSGSSHPTVSKADWDAMYRR